MKRFATLLVVIVITAFLMWGTTALLGPATDSEVFGIRVVGAGSFSWLTVGAGTGVLVVGVGGVGVVSIGLMGGAGILFGCGQVAAGSLVIGQLAVGVVATLAQVGVGLTGMGQLLGGFLVEGQVGLGFKDGDFFKKIHAELGETLRFSGDPRSSFSLGPLDRVYQRLIKLVDTWVSDFL